MKRLKILTIVLGVVCLDCIIIIFLLLKERNNNFDYLPYNELLNAMSSSIEYTLLEEYVGGSLSSEYWKEEVDSMYFYLDKLRRSNLFYDYCGHVHHFSESEKDRINNILKSLDRADIGEKEFVIELLKFLSLQSLLENRLMNYFPFDQVVGKTSFPIKGDTIVIGMVFPLNGDTINLGEEYIAAVPFCCINSEYKSILVLDGDTVETCRNRNIFSEKTTKRGYVKKEGYITYFRNGEQRLPVTVEYYVK